MDIYEAIHSRRSVRLFEDRAVDRKVLDRLLAAAGEAPSSANSQPWHFHVATGSTREAVVQEMALSTVYLQEYLESLPPEGHAAAERFFATLGGAPIVIGVSVPVAEDALTQINHYIAAGCALENLQLAVTAEGLGACNLTFSFWVRDKLAETLQVAEGREIISLVILGHPAEAPEAKPRNSDSVSYLD
jgi:nitroreductase